MPPWSVHKSVMRIKNEKDQELLLKLLDGSIPELHKRYRKLTHDFNAIPKLALVVALNASDPETTYLKALADMIDHVKDDELYYKFNIKNSQRENKEVME